MPAVEIVRRVWAQNYQWSEGKLNWRCAENIPRAALYMSSPYDLDVYYSKKCTTSWVGFKVHLTETCEQDSPHLFIHVETTIAPVTDDARTAPIYEGLKQKDLISWTPAIERRSWYVGQEKTHQNAHKSEQNQR